MFAFPWTLFSSLNFSAVFQNFLTGGPLIMGVSFFYIPIALSSIICLLYVIGGLSTDKSTHTYEHMITHTRFVFFEKMLYWYNSRPAFLQSVLYFLRTCSLPSEARLLRILSWFVSSVIFKNPWWFSCLNIHTYICFLVLCVCVWPFFNLCSFPGKQFCSKCEKALTTVSSERKMYWFIFEHVFSLGTLWSLIMH